MLRTEFLTIKHSEEKREAKRLKYKEKVFPQIGIFRDCFRNKGKLMDLLYS